MAFRAKYRGVCAANCGEAIKENQLIRYVDDQPVHDSCEDHVTPKIKAELCLTCFMEKPLTGKCCDDE